MSLSHSCIVICDYCKEATHEIPLPLDWETIDPYERQKTLDTAAELAGWEIILGKHKCPDCQNGQETQMAAEKGVEMKIRQECGDPQFCKDCDD